MKSLFVLFVAIFVFPIPASSACPDKWEQVGPKGGAVRSAAVHPECPETIYAGLGEGLYKTVDGGETWDKLPQAPTSVNQFVLSPNNPDIMYARAGYRLHKSTDGGATWEEITSFGTYSFALDPNDSDHLYAGTSGLTYYTPSGVYSSRDGGATWSYTEFVLCCAVSALIVDPSDGNIVYAGTAGDFDFPGDGVHKSTDGGETWVHSSTGFAYSNVECFAIDPRNTSTIYAGTSGGGQYSGAGIQKSLDGGATWTSANSGLPDLHWHSVNAIAIDPARPDVIYASVGGLFYKSLNAAADWIYMDTGMNHGGIYSIDFYPGNTNRLYLGSGKGVLLSTTGGAKFTESGITPVAMTSVVVDHNDPDVLYATGHGTFKSTDYAAHWHSIDKGLPTGQVIRQNPTNDGILYHGSYSPRGAVFRTTNGGANWTKTLLDVAIDDISIAPSNPSIIFAGGLEDPYVGAIFKSADTGVTWSIVNPRHADCIAVDPTNAEIVYAGTRSGLLKTEDGGATWFLSEDGIDRAEAGYLLELVVDPHHPNTVYCGTYNQGIFKTVDGGEHWFNASEGIPDHHIVGKDVRAMAIDPVDPQILYAAVRAVGFYVTVDGAQVWRRLSGRRGECNIVVDPNNRNVIYSAGGGVWRYVRTSECAEPEVVSYGPDLVTDENCAGGCTVSFTLSTDDDCANIAVVALERKLGSVWVQEDQLPGPVTCGDWTLTSVFDEHYADGEHVFRVVIREADGARAVSEPVVVTADRGVPVTFSGVEAQYAAGVVTVRWTIVSGARIEGFNVYRSSSPEPEFRRINGDVIPAGGASEFTDNDVRPSMTYTYRVGAIDGDGEWFSQTTSLTIPTAALVLLQNHPNPFNSSTTISFRAPDRMRARLAVYSVDGKLVTTLLNETVDAGIVNVYWDGRDGTGNPTSSGVYFYSLTAGGRTLTKKMVLLK
ncbi:MAG: T9SS type A sorting domain-containing protein [Candidatus Latescibacterota bacterium]|nr:MAG: T9SS type A sorting domain-containing protein [Candidatus Latescibacterota bacterium]